MSMISNRYTLVEPIKPRFEGGCSYIWAAYDTNLNRPVALKTTKPLIATSNDPRAHQQLEREPIIMANLWHPAIIPIFDRGNSDVQVDYNGKVGISRDCAYYSMPWLAGDSTLTQSINSATTDSERLELTLKLEQICEAVIFAHANGVFHLDIKPDNIILNDCGRTFLMDWGLAFIKPDWKLKWAEHGLSSENIISGTPGYMAPEHKEAYKMQIEAHQKQTTCSQNIYKKISEKCDVFSLGTVLQNIVFGPCMPNSIEKVPYNLRGFYNLITNAINSDPDERVGDVVVFFEQLKKLNKSYWHLETETHYKNNGKPIVKQGEAANGQMYLILKGSCLAKGKNSSGEVWEHEMHQGEPFGEVAMFADNQRTATVEPNSDEVLLAKINRNDFEPPWWLEKTLENLATRLVEREAKIAECTNTAKNLLELLKQD